MRAVPVSMTARMPGTVRDDIALARQEHQDVALLRRTELFGCVDQRVYRIGFGAGLGVNGGSVSQLDRVGAALDAQDRGGLIGGAEMPCKALGVYRRRGDDEFEVRSARQQLREVAEQEVDVQRTLVGFVDNQRVVAVEPGVALNLGEQNAVGHELHARGIGDVVREPHSVPDHRARLGLQLSGNAVGDGSPVSPQTTIT